MINILGLDLETAPADLATIKRVYPYDKTKVAYGNTKDMAKRKAIEETHEKEWFPKLLEKAALDPCIGTVCAVGVISEGDDIGISTSLYTSETELLDKAWKLFRDIKQGGTVSHLIAGHFLHTFDLPFLIRRSQILGVTVPTDIMIGRYFNKTFVDTAKMWSFYEPHQYPSLEFVARVLNVSRPRLHGVEGKNFHKVLKSDPDKAISYLEDDLFETYAIAQRLINNQ